MALSENNKGLLIKFGIGAAVGLVAFFLIRAAVKRWGKSKGEQAAETTVYDYIEQVTQNNQAAAAIEEQASISRQTAKQIASKIQNAWGFINDDENAVYAALQQLKNYSDLQMVMQEYGIYKDEDLTAAIQSRMSSSEVAKCNTILQNKGIEYSF